MTHLRFPEPAPKSYDGMDHLVFLSWIRTKLADTDTQPFVRYYWDLRPANIIIEEKDNVVGYRLFEMLIITNRLNRIIDWDGVYLAPLKVASVSIADSLFQTDPHIRLAPEQAEYFQEELTRIEYERSGLNEISQQFLLSSENVVLSEFLTRAISLPGLHQDYPRVLREALRRTPETVALAASEWKAFSVEHYLRKGLPIPEWPKYIEIQESLGLYGRTPRERNMRKLKRRMQK